MICPFSKASYPSVSMSHLSWDHPLMSLLAFHQCLLVSSNMAIFFKSPEETYRKNMEKQLYDPKHSGYTICSGYINHGIYGWYI
jgi:hypothetical protein